MNLPRFFLARADIFVEIRNGGTHSTTVVYKSVVMNKLMMCTFGLVSNVVMCGSSVTLPGLLLFMFIS